MDDTLETQLSRIPLFQKLGKEHLHALARGVQSRGAQRGEVLFRKGDPGKGFYYVLEGQVKLSLIAASGNEKVVEILREGMSFGEAVLFIDAPYPVYAYAISDCRLLYIGRDTLLDAVQRFPDLALAMLGSLSRHLYNLIQEMEANCLYTASQRVVGYFLNEIPPGMKTVHGFSFMLPASKSVVASRLNQTPETFSRVLQNLRAQGLISIQGKFVHIPDVVKLRTFGQC